MLRMMTEAEAEAFHRSACRTDTGEFELAEPSANEAHLRELMDVAPEFVRTLRDGTIWHQRTSTQGAYFLATETAPARIALRMSYQTVELPDCRRAVEARSWQRSWWGTRTSDAKDQILFEELLPAHKLVVSSASSLTQDGLRFWFDLIGHAVRRGHHSGIILADGTRHQWQDAFFEREWFRSFGVSFEAGRGDHRRFFIVHRR